MGVKYRKNPIKKRQNFERKLKDRFGDKFVLISEYVDCYTLVTIYCKDCKTTFDVLPTSILRAKYGCKTCFDIAQSLPIVGVNDIWTVAPWMGELLKNPQDGYRYCAQSNLSTDFVCPICHTEYHKCIYVVHRNGLECRVCGKGVCYPEKFMQQVFNQLQQDVQTQYSPDWIAPRRYDFYFNHNGGSYIVEMDGGLGHGCENKLSKQTSKQTIEIDTYKDQMAKLHNINMIRIDCKYQPNKRFQYVKQHICNSMLNSIFDLSIIDWELCDRNAQKSVFEEIIELWNNGVNNHIDIANIVQMHPTSITSYLKHSEELGLTDYCHEDYITQRNTEAKRIIAIKKSKPVRCVETKEIFVRWKDADKKYRACLSNYFRKKQPYSGSLDDGTKLHWELLLPDEAELIKQQLLNNTK